MAAQQAMQLRHVVVIHYSILTFFFLSAVCCCKQLALFGSFDYLYCLLFSLHFFLRQDTGNGT